jgi:hypothetical protein
MSRLFAALLCLPLLAGCSSGSVAEGGAPNVLARFPPNGAADIVQVTVTDRLPARSIELVGPGGMVQPAYAINSETAPRGDYGGGPSFGLGVGGGSRGFSSGVGIGLPFGSIGSGSSSAGATVSNGYVRLPDRGFYLQTWRDWRVRVRLGDPPGDRVIEVEAPPPPA